MSNIQNSNDSRDLYSETPIKGLENIQNKALVIAPFEITKAGKLDPDLLLDTPGIININLYKKMVSGEDKEPTAEQFKTIKYISEIDSSNQISSFDIPVIFKYDKETNTRIIEKDLKPVSNNLDYIDFTIDVSNTDLSSETGSNGFFCVCQVQKISKPASTTAFTEVANEDFLFMIPSDECREIPELVEFDLLDSDNKVINIKRFGEPGEGVYTGDIYKDKVSLLLDGNDLTDKTGKTITNTGVTVDTSVKKYGSGSLKFNGSSYLTLPTSTDLTFGTEDFTIEMWFNIIQLIGKHQSIYCTCTNGTTPNALNITCGTDGRTLGLGIGYGSGASSLLNSNTKHDMNTWNHMAVIRTGGIIRLFLNGKNVGQVANTSSFVSDIPIVGVMYGTRYFKGYIDDFRITKGVARYTDNFTPPNELSYVININEQEQGQGYRIHPIMNISDQVNAEESFTPKFYLGSKYQRNIMEVLTPALKSKRTISNLKDMYLVDDLCINTLEKINILLENDQMIKFSERLYNLDTPLTPLREKLNADLILEYLSTPVIDSQNNDIAATLKTSLMEDYNFTQEEIDNLNDNLNTFKSRARIALTTPTIDNDKFRFNLPNTFIDGNKSKTEKKNLLVFGTNAGFDKFNLAGYSTPYSNISKRDTSEVLDYDNLTTGLTTLSSLEDVSTIKDFQTSYGDETQHILFENGNLYACRYVDLSQSYQYNRDGQGFTKQSFPLKLINTNVKSMYCGTYATFIIDNNNDVWALGGYSVSGTSTANPNYDFYGINSSGNYLPNWTKVFNSTPENTPKKVVGRYNTTWLLMESGELFCTGDIPKYFTFDGIQKYTKTWISLASNVTDVDCGDYHVCYTLTNGEVYVGDSTNENGLTTQSTNTTAPNTKILKILTNWIPINQTIVQIECTNENIYYLLSNGDVYGVGKTSAGQLGSRSSYGVATPKKLYTGVKRIIPQLFGRNNSFSVSMVELITGEIKCMGYTSDYKFGFYVDSNIGVTTPITLYPKVDKIFLTERNVLAIIDGKIFNSGYNWFSGTRLTNKTITEQFLNIAVSKNFEDILLNYKQHLPFTYIPLSTDIDDVGSKPVFENLTDITGFNRSDIVIDIPNVL